MSYQECRDVRKDIEDYLTLQRDLIQKINLQQKAIKEKDIRSVLEIQGAIDRISYEIHIMETTYDIVS